MPTCSSKKIVEQLFFLEIWLTAASGRFAPPRNQMNRYVLTCNNYTEDDIRRLNDSGAVYLIFGMEVSDAGTPHLQCYMETNKNWPYLRKKLPRYWMAPAWGTKEQNVKYCKKSGRFFGFGPEA